MSSTITHTTTPPVPGVAPTRTWHRPLVYFSVLSAVLAVASFVGLLVDERTVLGEPVWSKPFRNERGGVMRLPILLTVDAAPGVRAGPGDACSPR